MDLNKDVIRQWVMDLRTGDFTQVTGALAKVDDDGKVGYCCLGVLCEQAVTAGVSVKAEQRDLNADITERTGPVTGYKFDGWTGMPGSHVQMWAGLPDWDVPTPERIEEAVVEYKMGYNASRISLADLNDKFGFTFEQIADVLEAEYLTEVSV